MLSEEVVTVTVGEGEARSTKTLSWVSGMRMRGRGRGRNGRGEAGDVGEVDEVGVPADVDDPMTREDGAAPTCPTRGLRYLVCRTGLSPKPTRMLLRLESVTRPSTRHTEVLSCHEYGGRGLKGRGHMEVANWKADSPIDFKPTRTPTPASNPRSAMIWNLELRSLFVFGWTSRLPLPPR
ncbi:hypothetical protein FA13DRAFT_171200 [Coprinellus micaceus]|uniref:Uncharacterized protein n=1 Tax=Coprinellus micaceus TaxID=71717 RepID=A0A4Y7SHI4_COPMI|nr:hypothetical protein FA13DRAFT_171200 [Coprinellus micaceus]